MVLSTILYPYAQKRGAGLRRASFIYSGMRTREQDNREAESPHSDLAFCNPLKITINAIERPCLSVA